MKLVIAIIRHVDAGPVVERLLGDGYSVTRVASTGGFLRRGNVTLLVGVGEDQVEGAIDALRESCSPPELGQHRATVFVVDAPHFERF
jgi:uncharacterized protein YaaQ